jgi:hypothetical protein
LAAECLVDERINAAEGSSTSYIIQVCAKPTYTLAVLLHIDPQSQEKEKLEHVAKSDR